jgi:hypothetical protein
VADCPASGHSCLALENGTKVCVPTCTDSDSSSSINWKFDTLGKVANAITKEGEIVNIDDYCLTETDPNAHPGQLVEWMCKDGFADNVMFSDAAETTRVDSFASNADYFPNCNKIGLTCNAGKCVTCNSNCENGVSCTAATKSKCKSGYCDSTGRCAPCKTDGDCSTGKKCDNGVCKTKVCTFKKAYWVNQMGSTIGKNAAVQKIGFDYSLYPVIETIDCSSECVEFEIGRKTGEKISDYISMYQAYDHRTPLPISGKELVIGKPFKISKTSADKWDKASFTFYAKTIPSTSLCTGSGKTPSGNYQFGKEVPLNALNLKLFD